MLETTRIRTEGASPTSVIRPYAGRHLFVNDETRGEVAGFVRLLLMIARTGPESDSHGLLLPVRVPRAGAIPIRRSFESEPGENNPRTITKQMVPGHAPGALESPIDWGG